MNPLNQAPNPFVEARKKRDAAIAVAVDHADAVFGNWSDQAFDCLIRYCCLFKKPFRCEQLRAWAEEQNCPVPPTTRAWGGIMARGKKQGVINRLGYTNSVCDDQPNTNMSVVSLWAAAR